MSSSSPEASGLAAWLYGPRPESQLIALAALLRSLALVQDVAHRGEVSDPDALDTCVTSTLTLDADSAQAVYGSLAAIEPGFRLLLEHLRAGQLSRLDPERLEQARYAGSILSLERRLAGMTRAAAALGEDLAEALSRHGAPTPGEAMDVRQARVDALAALYTRHVSPLGPKVMVSGSPAYLRQESMAATIRALLLAALRAAVLWRQSGGTRIRLLLFRRRYAARARELLEVARAGG